MTATTRKATRQQDDQYFSPRWMPQELVKRVPLEGPILECCAGRKLSIAGYLKEQGHDVITADIDPLAEVDYHLDMTNPESWIKIPRVKFVISNPPFNLLDKLLPLAYEYSITGLCLLMRASYIEPTMTGTRAEWLYNHPITSQIVLPRYSFSRSPKTNEWQVDSNTCAWNIWRKDRWVPDCPIAVVPASRIEGFHRRPLAE